MNRFIRLFPFFLFSASFVIAQTQVRLNQLGYLPDGPKFFEIPVQSGVADSFYVLDPSGTVVLKGALGPSALDGASAETLRRGDFSALRDTGCFQVRAGAFNSPSFHISSHLYDRLAQDAAHAYRLIRANDSLLDTALGIHHGPAHGQDSSLLGRDLRGGWYNAGDYGKWAHEAAFTVAHILWLNELKPARASEIPDLLNEARRGLDWLFRMQTDSGAVIHKVDTEGCWGWGKSPERDNCTRQASFQEKGNMTPSTVDAATFAAVMAQAYRNYVKSDMPLAQRCSTAAVLSWKWAEKNPAVGQSDPYYTVTSPASMMTWAAGEIFALNGDAGALSVFRKNYSASPDEPTWAAPGFFGYIALARSSSTPATLRDSVLKSVAAASAGFLASAQASGYGQALGDAEYYWGSNAHVLGKAMVMTFDYELNGDAAAKSGALAQLDYVLGRNALGMSMVTGYGTVRTMHPYHWIYRVYNVVMPGWLSGGPNSYASGADAALLALINAGTPAAKCWLDTIASYASNEGSTDQNAPLLFLSGYFASDTLAPLPPSEALRPDRARIFRSREPQRTRRPVDAKGCSSGEFNLLIRGGARTPTF